MVFESTDALAVRARATSARCRRRCRPTASRSWPSSTSRKAAWDQYQLPYTIVRPFNCVGIGESRALGDVEVVSGNVKLAMSHVVPDLVQKMRQGPGPAAHPRRRQPGPALHLRRRPRPRHRRRAWSTTRRCNEDFNLSTAESTHGARAGRDDLAQDQGPDAPLPLVSDPAFEYDVQKRVPDVDKAKRGPGLRGDDHPRRDARRGHPVDRPGDQGRLHLSLLTSRDLRGDDLLTSRDRSEDEPLLGP